MLTEETKKDLVETKKDLVETKKDLVELVYKYNKLYDAIVYHHGQKAEDRCIEDDDKLYKAADLPPCDRRVGDKFEMAKNCFRFIDNRCEGGHWPIYVELETRIKELEFVIKQLKEGTRFQG